PRGSAGQRGGADAGEAQGAPQSASEGPPGAAVPGSPPDELPARWEDMLLVPGGAFTMGADSEGELDERPAHTVTLPAFYLDETEMTHEGYARCVAAGRGSPPDPRNADANGFGPDRRFRGRRQPVSSVPWDSARACCDFLGKRLPSEAEFEKAARGVDGRRYPWGNEPPDAARAVFGASVTADVGTHPEGRGPYGHQDLAGNVWEWTADVYDPYAYRRPGAERGEPGSCAEVLAAQEELRRSRREGFTGSNPIPTECERVLRGGAFNYPARGLRASNRVHHPGRFRLVMSGFRCAKDAEAVRRAPR
ncbi:MAG: formylglycine-generating enzyme family protein, partial [Polyangiaceae bacterium]|nr:formylglycine-generating enzyme family protein [Polyangiaceae bacterium]